MKQLFISSLLLFSIVQGARCQTNLQAGDIAFLGFQSQSGTNGSDRFAFVLLKDIEAETEIIFSDNAVLNPSPVRFCQNEGFSKWMSTSNLLKGTIVSISEAPAASTGSVTGGLGLSQSGDQILAMQVVDSDTVMLAGISCTTWEANCATSCGGANNNRTCLPPNLENGVNAVGFPVKRNNMYFTSDDLSGTPAEILAAINNPANWTAADELQVWPEWSVSVVTSNSDRWNESEFKVFPSRSSGEFTIDCSSGEGLEVTVLSMVGTLVFSEKLGKGKHQMELSQVPSGVYLVHALQGSGKRFVQKIEITH